MHAGPCSLGCHSTQPPPPDAVGGATPGSSCGRRRAASVIRNVPTLVASVAFRLARSVVQRYAAQFRRRGERMRRRWRAARRVATAQAPMTAQSNQHFFQTFQTARSSTRLSDQPGFRTNTGVKPNGTRPGAAKRSQSRPPRGTSFPEKARAPRSTCPAPTCRAARTGSARSAGTMRAS